MLINTLTLIILIINKLNVLLSQHIISNTAICPLKCFCNEEIFSIYCSNLSRTEVRQLFISGGAFPTQFSSSLQNLSILNSEIESMGIFPRMEKLLILNLRGNNLEHIGSNGKSLRRDASGETIRSLFPSLISLDLSENKITSISRNDFISFPNIEEIILNQNRIFSIEWEAFRLLKLKKLTLRGNYLLTINEHMLRDSPAIEVLDLSQNQLSVAQSSSFFAAQKLKSLNLSHNRLHRFDYDSFSPLFQLEFLDLSYNNFSTIPADLRQFVALRMLNFSGNPITKICEGELVQPMLQNLDISNCKNLRLIEQRSFSFTPVLQFLKLANNSQLQYISPYAFQNSLLYELVISNNSLETIDNKILEQPTRLFISGNPFDCSCAEETFTNYAQKIVDLKEATCKARKGISQNSTSTLPLTTIIKSSNKLNQECSNKPLILPFGNYLNASVGEYFSLYCAPRRTSDKTFLYWKLPNGTTVQSDDQIKDTVVFNIPTIIQSFTKDGRTSTWIPFHKQRQRNPRLDTESHSKSLTNIHNHQHQRERVQVTGEQLRFEVIMLEDAGEYICSVDGVEAKLHLSVHAPSIQLKPVEIGSHYVALVWNDSLKIRALERVQLSLRIRDAVTGQTGRITQLSLYNPWHSYNVVRLRPLTNYTICLVYSLRSIESNTDGHNSNIDSSAKLLYKSCIDVKTLEQLGFWSSLSPTAIVIFCILFFICCFLFCFRAIYMHFYIWHDAKMRARMNQSMSGQSFLSHSSSLPLPTNSNGINNSHDSGTLTRNGTFFDSNSATLNKTSLSTETYSESLNKKNSINKLSKIKRKSKLISKQQIKGNSMFLMENTREEKHQNKSTENIALC